MSGSKLSFKKWQTTAGAPSSDGDKVVMSRDFPAKTQGLFNDLSKNNQKRAYICEMPKGNTISKTHMVYFRTLTRRLLNI